MYTVESCVNFAKKLPSTKAEDYLIPYITKCAKDQSWRIRYLIAERIIELSKSFGKKITLKHLIGHYVGFLSDTESEVRTVAVQRLSKLLKETDEDEIADKVLGSLLELSKDSFEYVRISLAENILSLAPILGKQKTNSHILPIFL